MPDNLAKMRTGLGLTADFARSTIGAFKNRQSFGEIQAYCMFIGYPSSGHSLVGSLLDAHPDVVVSHELDALRYIAAGFKRNQVFALILERSRTGREDDHYDYSVPSGWQGRFRTLRVVGDKKGGASTLRLDRDPLLLERTRTRFGVPLRLIHVIRNPFDSISTWKIRREIELQKSVGVFVRRFDAVARLRQDFIALEEILDLRYESLVEDPGATLAELCSFLDIGCNADYLDSCSRVVFDTPARRRLDVEWTPELRAVVSERIDGYDFLAGYAYSE